MRIWLRGFKQRREKFATVKAKNRQRDDSVNFSAGRKRLAFISLMTLLNVRVQGAEYQPTLRAFQRKAVTHFYLTYLEQKSGGATEESAYKITEFDRHV